MWLRKGEGVPVLVPEHMVDTIKRCLGDGWAEVADPRVVRETVPAPEPQPATTQPPSPSEPKRPAARRQKGRR